MATTKELRERRGSLEKKFQDIVNKAETEDRDLTAEEEATLATINTDDLALKNRIERQEQLASLGKELDEPQGHKIAGPGSHAGDGLGRTGASSAGDPETHALAMQGWARYQFGEDPTEEQVEACNAVGINPRSQKLNVGMSRHWASARQEWRNALTTPQPGKGGTFIAPSFVNNLEVAMLQFGPMLQIADLIDTDTGAELPYPTMNDTSNEGVMMSELEEATEQDIATGKEVFGAHEATSQVVVVSQAMLDDSAFDLVNVLSETLGMRLGRLMNRKCTLGTNANEPHGIVPAATVGKETASATAFTADEILDLISSVDPAYRADPSFGLMANEAVWSVLKKLKATSGEYLWQRSLQDGTPDRFDGWPIWTNQHMSGTIAAAEKVLLAGALRKYKIRRVRNLVLRRMQEKYATQNADGFVAFIRFDGGLVDAGTHPIKVMQMKVS